MTSKAVFLDVDGTLIDERGRIPASAREAVRQARANGHRVFLATGRSVVQLWDELHEIGFDGAITGAGAHVEVGGEVLAATTMTREQVARVVEYLDRHGVEYLLESYDGLIGSPRADHRMREHAVSALGEEQRPGHEDASRRFLSTLQLGADPHSLPIHKVCFFDSALSLDQIRAEFDDEFVVIPASVAALGDSSGELSPVGVHKAVGLELICDHLGIDRAHTVAIGDGMNDLEMLQHAGVGVAMGSAPQVVKDAADAVTGRPEEHGIRDAFLRLRLIEDQAAVA